MCFFHGGLSYVPLLHFPFPSSGPLLAHQYFWSRYHSWIGQSGLQRKNSFPVIHLNCLFYQCRLFNLNFLDTESWAEPSQYNSAEQMSERAWRPFNVWLMARAIPQPKLTRAVRFKRPSNTLVFTGTRREHSSVLAGCLSVEVKASPDGYVVWQGKAPPALLESPVKPWFMGVGSRPPGLSQRSDHAGFSVCCVLTVRRVTSSLTLGCHCGVNAVFTFITVSQRCLWDGEVVGSALWCLLPSSMGAEILSCFSALLGWGWGGGLLQSLWISSSFTSLRSSF